MLAELQIENLGVIEHVELVLGDGLTAVTGETGAGKTMLVEAIELVVGGRADASMVRPGAAEARVDARFVVDDEDMVLSRVVPVEGRSRAYVNGRVATVATLAELTASLVDLHGQHAHQTLLSARTQRAALDAYGGVDLEPLRAARARLVELDAELASLGGDERARAREVDLLRFQLAELDRAGLTDADEDSRLEAVEDALADSWAHREAGAAASELLAGDGGARDALVSALDALGRRRPYDDVRARLAEVLVDVDDVTTAIRRALDGIEDDPQQLAAVRERRQLLRDLCRKYGADLAEVMAFHVDASERLAVLEGFERRAAELDQERRRALDAERDAARAVGDRRREVAPELASAVQARLRVLAMPSTHVVVDVGQDPDDPAGERVQFLVSVNPGAPVAPLAKVASGGELARAMLALRLVLCGAGTATGGAATLVFDEVDAGIGGSAATAVADALAEVAQRHQVLVVTHLPQVAAVADQHVVVAKHVRAGVTRATVEVVDGESRVGEVARMLAGDETDVARHHARTLLERS